MLVNDYFRATREFVAAQRDIMLAYLGSDPASRTAVTAPRTLEQHPRAGLAPETAARTGDGERAPGGNPLAVITALISGTHRLPDRDDRAPDLDLERDLSIDSIKRTELAGELATRYGLEPTQIDQLTQISTAAELAERLGGGRSAPSSPARSPRPPRPMRRLRYSGLKGPARPSEQRRPS